MCDWPVNLTKAILARTHTAVERDAIEGVAQNLNALVDISGLCTEFKSEAGAKVSSMHRCFSLLARSSRGQRVSLTRSRGSACGLWTLTEGLEFGLSFC